MDGSLRKTDVSHNIVKLLNGREKDLHINKFVHRHAQFSEPLVNRLALEHELEGHQGCVNCLEWSPDGKRLASGSDDTKVIIWDPFTHRMLGKISTPHVGNIFSVKFLGNDSSLIATGAGDCRVIVQSIERTAQNQTPHLDCSCHLQRIKRLATARDEPSLFWSAGEDGMVIQYDLRESHECMTKSKILLDLSCSISFKCIAINPVRSHLMAIGANDCFVRLYDRRMIKTIDYESKKVRESVNGTTVPQEPQDVGCVEYFAPGHLAKDYNGEMNYKLQTTYVAFNSTGTDMLVNIGGEQIYLYDVDNPRHVSEMQIPADFPKRKSNLVQNPCCENPIAKGKKDEQYLDLFNVNNKIAESPCICDYLVRGQIVFDRKWTGDIYAAARDYLHIIQHCPENTNAYLGLIQCLLALHWIDDAFKWLEYLKVKHPHVANTLKYKELYNDLIEYRSKLEKEEKVATNECEAIQVVPPKRDARDFETHFIGHCNTTTDIKEANFLGENGDFICAGSDDGIIFIWNRKTSNIIRALWGDVSIVNCVQPHPSACFLATSGIDPVVKLWSPAEEEGALCNPRLVSNPWSVVETNQQRMAMDPFETMLANMGYRINTFDGPDLTSCRTS